MSNVHFAIPEIYGETLSYYELLRKLVDKTNELIENYNTVPEQIADAVKNLDAAQLFSAVLKQLIDTIATDNTKSNNAVKVYKKHDLLYATFNETVKLYESIIDFTPGTETELIPDTNIREVNISELFIELRKLIDINKNNIEAETTRATAKETELKSDIDYTKTSVLNEIKAWVNETQHPIGSIYITTNNINPSSIFGGTWEQLQDRFLIGAGSSYSNGDAGGATSHTHTTASHVLTIEEMPEHGHGYKLAYGGNDPVKGFSYGNTFAGNHDDSDQFIANNGGGQAHSHGDTGPSSNMPPYLAVYMWKRTA